MQANTHTARPGLLRIFAAVARNACVVRYRLDRPSGALYLLAATLDPFIYSATIYFVLATVFDRAEPIRFYFLLLGLISFRWTLSCLLHALNLQAIRARLSEVTRHGHIGAIVAVMAPSTLAFLLSLALAMGWIIAVQPAGQSMATLWMLPAVILLQGFWTVILVAAVDLLHRKRIVVSQAPIVAFAAIVWFLSPFMYGTDDISPSAGRIMTSYNPVTHVLAAYRHTYWFGTVPSLKVLPAAAVVTIIGIVAFRRFGSPARTVVNSTFVATPHTAPMLVIITGAVPSLGLVKSDRPEIEISLFTRWHRQLGSFTGAGMARLILSAQGSSRRRMADRLKDIQASSGVGRLFEQELSIYPDWALDQLAFALAVSAAADNLVLDGLVNAATPEFTASAWRRMEADREKGRLITVVADRPISLPANAHGYYRVVGPSGIVAEGDFREGMEPVKAASNFRF